MSVMRVDTYTHTHTHAHAHAHTHTHTHTPEWRMGQTSEGETQLPPRHPTGSPFASTPPPPGHSAEHSHCTEAKRRVVIKVLPAGMETKVSLLTNTFPWTTWEGILRKAQLLLCLVPRCIGRRGLRGRRLLGYVRGSLADREVSGIIREV